MRDETAVRLEQENSGSRLNPQAQRADSPRPCPPPKHIDERDAYDRLLTPDPVERALLQIEADTALAEVPAAVSSWLRLATRRGGRPAARLLLQEFAYGPQLITNLMYRPILTLFVGCHEPIGDERRERAEQTDPDNDQNPTQQPALGR